MLTSTLFVLAALIGQTPAAALAATPTIKLPDLPSPAIGPVNPPPRPSNATAELTQELLYVAESKTEWLVLTSPEGLVAVTAESGPLRVRGRFLDDPAKVQTKTFAGPFVYSLEATGVGLCEVMFVPIGAKSASDVVRRTIKTNNGAKPPPPKPDQDPDPKPPELTGWAKAAKGWAEAVNRPTRKAEAAALAKSFRAGASAAAAGAFKDVASMSASIRDANRAALGDEPRADWLPFFQALSKSANESITTVGQYATVCNEVATGLEAVQ